MSCNQEKNPHLGTCLSLPFALSPFAVPGSPSQHPLQPNMLCLPCYHSTNPHYFCITESKFHVFHTYEHDANLSCHQQDDLTWIHTNCSLMFSFLIQMSPIHANRSNLRKIPLPTSVPRTFQRCVQTRNNSVQHLSHSQRSLTVWICPSEASTAGSPLPRIPGDPAESPESSAAVGGSRTNWVLSNRERNISPCPCSRFGQLLLL